MEIRTILASLPHHIPKQTDWWDTAGWIASPDCYPVYEQLFRRFNPRSMLEIGTLLGYCVVTALHSASRLRDVAWVDNETGVPWSNALAFENVRYYLDRHRRRKVALRYWRSLSEVQDVDPELVHVDGDHSYESAKADLEWVLRHCRPRVILCHDVSNPNTPGVFQAITEVVDKYHLRYEHVDALNGIGVLTCEKP